MNKLKFFCALSVIISGVLFFAGDSLAATINAASCSYADVSAAISAAAPEDTVNVPTGNCTWTSTLTITKGINLMGPGAGNLTIKNGGGGYLIHYIPSNYDANYAFRLSGFTFDASGGRLLELGRNTHYAPFMRQTKVRIDHNSFINVGAFGGAIYDYNDLYGVVDNNYITGCYPVVINSGTVLNDWWVESPQNIFNSGDSNFLFFEDNTFVIGGGGSSECDLTGYGQYSCRYLFRYNTITQNNPAYSFFEMHGYQPTGGMDACFGAELYGNQVTTNNNALTFFKTRSGKSFVYFNNAVASSLPSIVAYTGTTASPCPTDALASFKVINNNYWFNNRINSTGQYFTVSASNDMSCAGLTGIPMLGRDIFTNNTSPGVSCGTLANRPGTCTVGQGYWATNQSCSNLTGMVGKNPTNPIFGTLYKCTVPNTWTAYYTPYIYPHPLRSGVVPTPTPTSTPTPTPIPTPTPTPTSTPSPAKHGDLNNDNRVDVIDLGILLSNWNSTSRPSSDINQDGRVDVIDLGILLSNWG